MAKLDDMLKTLNDQTDCVAVRTSAVGQESLKRDVRRVFYDHQTVLTTAQELVKQLQLLLQRWAEFESLRDSFTSWLETAMHNVRSANEMVADLDAKLEQVTRVKVSLLQRRRLSQISSVCKIWQQQSSEKELRVLYC